MEGRKKEKKKGRRIRRKEGKRKQGLKYKMEEYRNIRRQRFV